MRIEVNYKGFFKSNYKELIYLFATVALAITADRLTNSTILTYFIGSGKTTNISQLIEYPPTEIISNNNGFIKYIYHSPIKTILYVVSQIICTIIIYILIDNIETQYFIKIKSTGSIQASYMDTHNTWLYDLSLKELDEESVHYGDDENIGLYSSYSTINETGEIVDFPTANINKMFNYRMGPILRGDIIVKKNFLVIDKL